METERCGRGIKVELDDVIEISESFNTFSSSGEAIVGNVTNQWVEQLYGSIQLS